MKRLIPVFVLVLLLIPRISLAQEPVEDGMGADPPLWDVMQCMTYNAMLAEARLQRNNLQGGINMLRIELEMLGSDPNISLDEFRERAILINREIASLELQIEALDLYIDMLVLLISLMGNCPCSACEDDIILGEPIPDPNFP